MIRELAEFGKKKREDTYKQLNFDSLTTEGFETYIQIKKDGSFVDIVPLPEKRMTIVEDVERMENEGRTSNVMPRLIVDNAQYVLGCPKGKKRSNECLQKYIEKLKSFNNVKTIQPIIKFYEKKQNNIVIKKYNELISEKKIGKGNITFLLEKSDRPLHESKELYNAIEVKYNKLEKERKEGREDKCSVCGSNSFRTYNIKTHGSISRVPGGQPSGCYLIAYNADAFTSYGLEGNDNSLLCTNCVKNYVEGLNWLMQNGKSVPDEKGKERFVYSNRKRISFDTAMVFWTRKDSLVEELHLLDKPDIEEVRKLLNSIFSGEKKYIRIKPDTFYAVSLSGAAARIAVRGWIETSVQQVRVNIVKWFSDIGIIADGKTYYAPMYQMGRSCDNPRAADDQVAGRVGTILWHSAIENLPIPLWILSSVLSRIKAEQGAVTPVRASLIKLFLNRNPQKGGYVYMEKLDPNNKETAYICGCVFAVLERIQWHALGETNANIRDRFFSSASTTPGLSFGRLMNLAQKHLSKLKSEKPGLSVNLDYELQELCKGIRGKEFPVTFRLEDQGAFALGYYHQKNKKYSGNNKQEADHE